MESINRFCYESLNYESVYYEWQMPWNKGRIALYVPRFIAEIAWTCDTDHMVEKWIKALRYAQPAAFVIFYVNLDATNQDKMAEWIMKNGTCGGGHNYK